MVRGLIEDRSELEALFDEFAHELAMIGKSAQLVMVGDAWMLWKPKHGLVGPSPPVENQHDQTALGGRFARKPSPSSALDDDVT